MALTYSILTGSVSTNGSIANWLNHAALQNASSFIVNEAESFIYRRLRAWQMLTSTTGNITVATGSLSFPSDYIEDKFLMITGVNNMTLVRKPMQEVLASWSYDGSGNRVPQAPNIYFNDKTNIVFDTYMDQTYPYLLYYYQNPAALSSSNETNFLTNTYPRLMRCALMIGAAEFMKDAGVGQISRDYWINEAEKEIIIAQAESDRSEHTMQAGYIQI